MCRWWKRRCTPPPCVAADLAKQFARVKPADVGENLATLATLGRARRASGGKFLR